MKSILINKKLVWDYDIPDDAQENEAFRRWYITRVLTHGTATLEESAYLMDLTLGSDKPVVFTGAQRNADEKDPDGPRNLLYAVMIAADPEARGRGVMAALAGQIYSARDVNIR